LIVGAQSFFYNDLILSAQFTRPRSKRGTFARCDLLARWMTEELATAPSSIINEPSVRSIA
jgi:hypothetical protein